MSANTSTSCAGLRREPAGTTLGALHQFVEGSRRRQVCGRARARASSTAACRCVSSTISGIGSSGRRSNGWPAPVDVVHAAHPLLIPARRAAQRGHHPRPLLPHQPGADARGDSPRLRRARRRHARARRRHRHAPPQLRQAAGSSTLRTSRPIASTCAPPGAPRWETLGRAPQRAGRRLRAVRRHARAAQEHRRAARRLRAAAAARRAGCRGWSSPAGATADSRSLARSHAQPPLSASRAAHRGYVAADEREALYAGARALVLPSLDEGFGLTGARGDVGRRAGGRLESRLAAGGGRRRRQLDRPDDARVRWAAPSSAPSTTRVDVGAGRGRPGPRRGFHLGRCRGARLRQAYADAAHAGGGSALSADRHRRAGAGRPSDRCRPLPGRDPAAWAEMPAAAAHEFILCAPQPVSLPRIHSLPPRVVGRTAAAADGGTLWEQLVAAALVRAGASRRPVRARLHRAAALSPAPVVLTVHDVSFCAHPEWFSWREGARRRLLTRLAAHAARRA